MDVYAFGRNNAVGVASVSFLKDIKLGNLVNETRTYRRLISSKTSLQTIKADFTGVR